MAVYECLVRNRLADRVYRKAGWADAFLYIQQAKSRSLAELISRSAPDRGGSDLSPHRAEVEAARRNLNAQHRRLEQLALSSAAPAQIAALREGVQESERVLQRLAAIASSETAADWLSQSQPLSVEQIQAAIPAGATLLEYYAVKGVLHVCLVRSSSLHVMPLAAVDQIKNSMRLLRFQIRRFRLGRDDRRFHGQGIDEVTDHHLRELETLLIAPLRRHLSRSSHLIVAPHDFLHHLPFHALRRPSGYLIDEFTISYAPSATVYARCATRPNRFDNQALVLGLADPRAPSIELEAKAAAAALPNARLFLGHDATEDVLRRYGSRSRFLHIATHGLFRRDNPLFSAIRLGDMYLTLFDLYRLPLAAELVTLSGCSTGLNVVVGADELLGLTRGLLLAGAQGVMVSLWDVNDLSTAGFMRHFYLELQRNSNKAAAMRAAMRALREEYSHPYHWAPFQLAGKYVDLPAGSAGPQRIT